MTRTIAAVLFDLDNTLADRDRGFVRWARWFARERLGLALQADIDAAVAEMIVLDRSGHGPKDAMFRTLAARFPVLTDPIDALVIAFRDQMLVHLPPLNAGAARLLAALDDADIPWGIVSNGSRSRLRKIEKLALDSRAGCIVISEIVAVRKPDPAIFRLAAEHLQVRPADVLFIGDHPEADIRGAAGAGMRTVWLRHGREWPARLARCPPDWRIDSLDELLWIVDQPLPEAAPGT